MFFAYGQQEIEYLKKRDKKMAVAIDKLGLIQRPLTIDIFSALIKNIVDQQISVKAAQTVNARLLAVLDEISAERIVATLVEVIQACGMTMKKAGYIKGIADAVLSGVLDLTVIHTYSDEEIIKQLSSLKGVGIWTAEMLLISALSRPDVVSWGDLAIRRGMMNLYNHQQLTKACFDRYRKRYSPYGSTASLYLWELSKESQ